jgi:hypothetical protein
MVKLQEDKLYNVRPLSFESCFTNPVKTIVMLLEAILIRL